MSARKELIESIESALNFNKDGAEKFFDKVVSAIKEELTPKDQTFQEFFGLDEKPKFIQGYTAENWQEIIDGGYLCEFSFSTDFDRVYSSLLSDHGHDEHEGTHYFHPVNDKTNDFQYCRPAQIKGVMRPIFVEPVDRDAWCVFFDKHGMPKGEIIASSSQMKYRFGLELSVSRGITKYIEL